MKHPSDAPSANPPDVCVLHLDLTTVLAGIRSDVKWLLRLGYGVTLLAATVIGLLYPYFSSLNTDITNMKAQIAVNTRQLTVLSEADQRSEADRASLRKCFDELQKSISKR